MDQDFAQISFILTLITFVVILLMVLLVNLMLTARNRRFEHRAEILKLESEVREQIANIRVEEAENALADVSRDLHDEVGQLLTFCVLQLENISGNPSDKQQQMLHEVKKTVRDTLDAIRSISRGLSPDYINQLGLAKSIEQLLERARGRTGIKTIFQADKDFQLNNSSHSVIIFRIIRECLTNAIRHGKAKKISLKFISGKQFSEVVFYDDGVGMDDKSSLSSSLGWKNMQHYAKLMNAAIEMNPEKKSGTEIKVTIPI